jgi:hypothetical protein
MKKADNFDASKWLVENKVTFQSRLNEDEAYLSPSMQKQFNMIVSALKKAKSQEDIDQVHSNLMLLPKKLTKIFIDKLVNMGLANREGEGKYSLDYDDGLDESKLNEGSDTYPFQADPETIALYDRIASKLEGTISMVASKLEIPKSDIRISLDYLYDDLEDNKSKKKGMFIQVKTDDATWDEAWTGNPLIMQTTNDEGIVIPSNPFFGVNIKGNKNPKVRAIYNKALDLDLESLAASENAKIADLVSPEEMKLIAPNTPIVVTGK